MLDQPQSEEAEQEAAAPVRIRGRGRVRPRPLGEEDFATAPAVVVEDEPRSTSVQPSRPSTCLASAKPRLMLCESFLSPAGDSGPCSVPASPGPDRDDFKHIAGRVAVIFFDFDGTLTATPGDRAARRTKMTELCERAPMLRQKLQALREAGANLGIISKSTETTIREALQAADLASFWTAPIIGNAVGFEGKVGFIQELAMQGMLPGICKRGFGIGPSRWALVCERILLVDDDVLELGRAHTAGLETYAAPEEGGLQEHDLDVIIEAVQNPLRGCRMSGTLDSEEVLSPGAGLLSISPEGVDRAGMLLGTRRERGESMFDMFDLCCEHPIPRIRHSEGAVPSQW